VRRLPKRRANIAKQSSISVIRWPNYGLSEKLGTRPRRPSCYPTYVACAIPGAALQHRNQIKPITETGLLGVA
jgi:hypothetical protein